MNVIKSPSYNDTMHIIPAPLPHQLHHRCTVLPVPYTGSAAYNLPRPNLIGRTVVIIPRPQTEATRITLIGHTHLLTCPPPIAASKPVTHIGESCRNLRAHQPANPCQQDMLTATHRTK